MKQAVSLITLGVDVIVIAPHNGDAMAKAVTSDSYRTRLEKAGGDI